MAEDEPPTNGGTTFDTGLRAEDARANPGLVDTPVGQLALVEDAGEWVAIEPWCPHLDGPVWEGSVADGQIACPWHGWRFSLTTGECTWAPRGDAEEAAETELRRLPVHEGPGGTLVIELDAGGDRAET